MKNVFVFLMVLWLFLPACTSLRVVTERNSHANFGTYTSFAFVEHPVFETDPFTDHEILTQVKELIRQEMFARAYTESHDPDLWIDFSFFREDQIHLIPDPWFYQEEGSRSLDSYDFQMYQYREEYLIIDVLDATQEQWVWKGSVIRILTTQDTQSIEERAKEAIKTLFDAYPNEHHAEEGTPISLIED